MIKATYSSNSKPEKMINVNCPFDHLCLINGKEALSCLEIMELKGFFSYTGTFSIEGNDLLDATNLKRDRTAVSVITASSSSCVVTRSQIPFGSTPKTEKIDEPIRKYINLKGVPTQWQSSFFMTVQSVYIELCAHPLYVVLDLARADKKFALFIIDILGKVLHTYRIYVYAPQVFPYPSEDIVFYDDINSIVNPSAPRIVEHPQPQNGVREMVMARFFDDLSGKSVDREEERRPQKIETRQEKPSIPVEETARPAPEVTEEEKEESFDENQIPTSDEESGSIFRFDPKKTDVYNFVFGLVFFVLSIVISFVFFSFKNANADRITTFFWICLAMCLAFFAMSIVPIASLIQDNKGQRFRDSKFLIIAICGFPVAAVAAAIVLLILGNTQNSDIWIPARFVPFAVAFFVYAAFVPTFSFLFKLLRKKK
ncbi:MAG: hypothetical protein MJ239_00425 [Bacilli bacterium]|nr:hypothetical protein [Bacilli bacterium]